jgi:hypothetical protein
MGDPAKVLNSRLHPRTAARLGTGFHGLFLKNAKGWAGCACGVEMQRFIEPLSQDEITASLSAGRRAGFRLEPQTPHTPTGWAKSVLALQPPYGRSSVRRYARTLSRFDGQPK